MTDLNPFPGCLTGAAVLRESAPWPGFTLAADAAVQHLRERFGLDLWMVSHTGADGQTVVASAGPWTELARPGAQFRWTESLCRRFLTTGAGIVVPDVHIGDPTIAAGPLSRIRSYLGVPLVTGDHEMFGTLCAYHGQTWSTSMDDVLASTAVLGRMLSTIRAGEQAAFDRSAEAAEAYAAAARDPLTGLLNRRGWQAALDVEEQRVQRYGGPASVLVLDLDDLKQVNDTEGHAAGNQALRACAQVLDEMGRPGDAAARTGGDEFALLAVHCDAVCARAMEVRLRAALRSAGVAASVGSATRRVGEDLERTFHRADQDMYRDKRRRHVTATPRAAWVDPESEGDAGRPAGRRTIG
jgi:diguanylate cyclase